MSDRKKIDEEIVFENEDNTEDIKETSKELDSKETKDSKKPKKEKKDSKKEKEDKASKEDKKEDKKDKNEKKEKKPIKEQLKSLASKIAEMDKKKKIIILVILLLVVVTIVLLAVVPTKNGKSPLANIKNKFVQVVTGQDPESETPSINSPEDVIRVKINATFNCEYEKYVDSCLQPEMVNYIVEKNDFGSKENYIAIRNENYINIQISDLTIDAITQDTTVSKEEAIATVQSSLNSIGISATVEDARYYTAKISASADGEKDTIEANCLVYQVNSYWYDLPFDQ